MGQVSVGLAVATALLASGCASTNVADEAAALAARRELNETLRQAAENADYAAIHYARLKGDRWAVGDVVVRASERFPLDAKKLDTAVYTLLTLGRTQEAIALAHRASPTVRSGSSYARIALASEDIVDGRTKEALDLITGDTPSPLLSDFSQFAAAWLLSERDPDAAQALLAQPARASLLLDADRLSTERRAQAELIRAASKTRASMDERKAATRAHLCAIALMLSRSGLAAQSVDVRSMLTALAFQFDPTSDDARISLAAGLARQGLREQSLSLLQGVSPSSALYARARLEAGGLLIALGRKTEAAAAVAEAVAAPPRDAAEARRFAWRAADILRRAGEPDRAIEQLNAVSRADAALNAADWRVPAARGDAYRTMGRLADQERELRAALQMAPDEPSLLNALATNWLEAGGDAQMALGQAQKALSLQPRNAEIFATIGWAQLRLARTNEAIAALERASERAPTAAINDRLGDAYMAVGRSPAAILQWRYALRLDPPPDLADRMTAKVAAASEPAASGATVTARADAADKRASADPAKEHP